MGNWERAYQYNINGWNGAIQLAKMRVGPLLIEFLTNMLHRIQGLDERRFLLYSAHDSTLSAILGVLIDKPLHWPGYASNFIIELWESTESTTNNKYFFRILYNGVPLKTAWCNNNSPEIHPNTEKYHNSTQSGENVDIFKKHENTLDNNEMNCNTLENLKNYLENTLNLVVDIEMDYNSKSHLTYTPSLMYDVDQECNAD